MNRTPIVPIARRLLLAAVALGAATLGLGIPEGRAQFAPITFPDTTAGATSTVKCPTNTVTICFGGANCAASGTITGLTAPAAPFSIGKFNVLSLNEFFAGNCEAHPVTLPAAVGPGQVFAYQATFAPTAAGTFNGSFTINTSGGPAVISLSGKGVAGASGGLGSVELTVTPPVAVPGNRVEIAYEITANASTGATDLLMAIVLPTGQTFFLGEDGVTPNPVPLRRNIPPANDARTLGEFYVVDLPFGTYTFAMLLVQTGKPPSLDTLASPIATRKLTFAPLSEAQQAILQQRGNPDSYAMFWIDDAIQKREVWLYLGAQPTQFVFVNGGLDSSTPLSDPPAAAISKVDPTLFTPQTSLAELLARFGNPTGETQFSSFRYLTFSGGLAVVFQGGRIASVSTESP